MLGTLPAAASIHNYRLTVSDDLRWVDVTAALAEPDNTLRARNGAAGRLKRLATCEGQPLRPSRDSIRTGASDCVRYRYPLEREAGRVPTADALLTSPSRWLWMPRLAADDRILIDASWPDGVAALLPWPRSDEGYVLQRSVQSSDALAVFGDFTRGSIDVPGANLQLAYIGPPAHAAKIERWLTTAAEDVWRVGRRFPNPDATVVVIDVPGSGGEAVPFGHVIRDGGEAVRFFVQAESPETELHGDWTAPHEFAHLLLPYVREKWISEGFASYYQNVLLARRGTYSEAEAWRRLGRSFGQAAAMTNPPSPNDSRYRDFWEVRMLVYWSGAALALMADVELRRHASSLDEALERLSACCLPATSTWAGKALFAKLDALTGRPTLEPLYDRYADRAGMPPTEALYQDLGIEVRGDRVVLNNDAPLAHIRRAIMSPSS